MRRRPGATKLGLLLSVCLFKKSKANNDEDAEGGSSKTAHKGAHDVGFGLAPRPTSPASAPSEKEEEGIPPLDENLLCAGMWRRITLSFSAENNALPPPI
mmetsp:Transcript_42848/g.92473  ORF Transcript_42848/g.92473 Transcript_42848/m.92473 type:complete len:100 (-) Transcript_42848:1299-1598(-)